MKTRDEKLPASPPAEVTLAAAAEAARVAAVALASQARVAEVTFDLTPATVREIIKYKALPAAAIRSFLGDRLYRERREMYDRWFKSEEGGPGALVLAGPSLPWAGGPVTVRILTLDPGGELLPSLLLAAAAGLHGNGDGRVRAIHCEAIRRLDAADLFPAADSGIEWSRAWRFHLHSPVQLRVRTGGSDGEAKEARRCQVRAVGLGPKALMRAAWLRLAELAKQFCPDCATDSRFVDDPAFVAWAAGLGASSPRPEFCDVESRWRSKSQGKAISLNGVCGVWPGEGWSQGAAVAAIGRSGAVLLDVLLRSAAEFQIGRMTAYGCGQCGIAPLPADERLDGAGILKTARKTCKKWA